MNKLRSTWKELGDRARSLYVAQATIQEVGSVQSDTAPITEGWMRAEYYAPGSRTIKLSHAVYTGKAALICYGQAPDPQDRLPQPVARFQKGVAMFRNEIAQAVVSRDRTVHLELMPYVPDKVSPNVYTAVATCLFGTDPSLESIKLSLDEYAPEARLMQGYVFTRNTAEYPPGPVPAT